MPFRSFGNDTRDNCQNTGLTLYMHFFFKILKSLTWNLAVLHGSWFWDTDQVITAMLGHEIWPLVLFKTLSHLHDVLSFYPGRWVWVGGAEVLLYMSTFLRYSNAIFSFNCGNSLGSFFNDTTTNPTRGLGSLTDYLVTWQAGTCYRFICLSAIQLLANIYVAEVTQLILSKIGNELNHLRMTL